MATTNNDELDFGKFQTAMQKASKAVNHNAAMKAAFKQLMTAVEKIAEVFEDEYEAPAPKQRVKRGTGKAAQAKAAAAAANDGVGAADGGNGESATPAKKTKAK